jgi:hypothetical protein
MIYNIYSPFISHALIVDHFKLRGSVYFYVNQFIFWCSYIFNYLDIGILENSKSMTEWPKKRKVLLLILRDLNNNEFRELD